MGVYLKLATLLFMFYFENSEAQISIFDSLLPQLRIGKDLLLNAAMPAPERAKSVGLVAGLQGPQFDKLQPRLNDDVPFPCDLNNTRSKKRPKSVHRLKPGDIDVIGALGDSLTAGNGLAATSLWHVGVENRGISFSIGGQGTWRQFVTLPNILKEFNPRLIGYSLLDSYGHHAMAKFNAAEAGAMSRDMPYMTKVLINRMINDSSVNIRKDWKMISLMIGSNDFCAEMCYRRNPEDIVEEHRKDLLKTLRTLRDNLPRTIVNLVVSPNLTALVNITQSNMPTLCYFTHNFECPCLFGLQFKNLQVRFKEIMLKWQQVEMEFVNYPEFDREDFAVVAQPFTFEYKMHPTKEGLTDYSVFSRDCFHLSQKEAARAALSLWNNMLEPVGKKTTHPSELFQFRCPTKEHPFIFTKRNSS